MLRPAWELDDQERLEPACFSGGTREFQPYAQPWDPAVLRKAMADLDAAGGAWYDAARRDGTSDLRAFIDQYMNAVEAKRETGRAFQTAARRALNAEA